MDDELRRAVGAFRRVRGVTLAGLDRVPPQWLDWAPATGTYTCAELARHMAAVPPFYIQVMQGRTAPFSEPSVERAPDLPAMRDFLEGSLRQWEEFQAGATADQLAGTYTMPSGLRFSGRDLAWRLVEHETHHKGQLFTYLRILGVAPPNWAGS